MQGRIRVLHRLQVGCKRVWMVLEKGFTEIASSRGGRAGPQDDGWRNRSRMR